MSGKKRHFIKTDEAILINEIRKRPVLYDLTQKGKVHLLSVWMWNDSLFSHEILDYKRQASRQQAWEDVALTIDLSVNDVKKRWRSMRDAFIKHVRNTDEPLRGSILHYDLMEFLTPYVTGE